MSRPVLYVAITNHGFGHAVRAASVVAQIQHLNPEILVALVTTAPRWLLESYIPNEFLYRPRSLDVGVVQSDSLNMDKAATLEKLRDIQRRQNDLIAAEVNFIRLNRVGLVLADIPPLAARIANVAGIPAWMMSNFGWDFIYREWGGEFLEIADWIGDCFSQCDRLFRLPMHEPMSAFPQVTDTGLTGGTPRYSVEELRQLLNLTAPREKTILLSFGGLGLQQIPYHNLKDFPDWQFLTFDANAPDLPNLVQLLDIERRMEPNRRIRPVDLMPVCDRVVSKPGFSTFAEAMRLDVPIVSLTRDGFAEAQLLLDGLKNCAHHQIIPYTEFFEGNWAFLREPNHPPKTEIRFPKNGNETIAEAVVKYFEKF
ncbi:MAG: glycosyl transferase [Cyanobacteria bacterium SID2]|nr:glycosyl transferase [Cyanobacteria bacterium SID2]MBP0006812.1 glycosyl transferase [Cyanobacteria bacterium SBC]